MKGTAVRGIAAAAGAATLIAGWYTSMSAGVGAAYGIDVRPMMAVAGITWMLAGITTLVAAAAGAGRAALATPGWLVSGLAVAATALAAQMFLALIPAVVMLACGAVAPRPPRSTAAPTPQHRPATRTHRAA